jgi:hypothetical protein
MRKHLPTILFGAGLVLLSAVFALIHYGFYHDAHELESYVLIHLMLIPIDVLVVAMILHRLLALHEKRALKRKLNMVIGVFFMEAGTELLRRIAACDRDQAGITAALQVRQDWDQRSFADLIRRLGAAERPIDIARADLPALHAFLRGKRDLVLALLENPNLLEHEDFTDMLWAVFHLSEELSHRRDPAALAAPDAAHIAGDMRRAYQRLLAGWLRYMDHLRRDYPYLFSLALRTNPFDPAAEAEVKA